MAFLILKSLVHAHQRRLPDGRIIQVAEHQDRRTRKASPAAASPAAVDPKIEAMLKLYAGDAEITPDELREAVRQYREVESANAEVLRANKEQGQPLPAPNGKPSNLNRNQWVLVRTPNFKRWFGDWESGAKDASKVVDANGEPRVVYHGTGADMEAFSHAHAYSGEGASQTGSGFYFTDSADSASRYASLAITKDEPGRVMSVFLSARNPLYIDFSSGETTGAGIKLTASQVRKIIMAAPRIRAEDGPLSNFGDVEYDGFNSVLAYAISLYAGGSNIAALRNDFFGDDVGHWLRVFGDATGHDSAYTKTRGGDTHWIAWKPEQIKSAIGNAGTFRPDLGNLNKAILLIRLDRCAWHTK